MKHSNQDEATKNQGAGDQRKTNKEHNGKSVVMNTNSTGSRGHQDTRKTEDENTHRSKEKQTGRK